MTRDGVSGDGEPVVVIGLGRFGSALAVSLVRMGHDVLAIDNDPVLVQKWASELTHVVQADGSDTDALKQLGVGAFSRAVVGIGTHIEASVLTVLSLVEVGVDEVWAKAITKPHGKILRRVGAGHVVYVESSMGERVAHMVSGAMMDYIEFDDGFAIARTKAPRESYDQTLGDVALRTKYGITVVGVKRPGEDFTYARPETEVHRGDQLIVSGATDLVERFCALTQRSGR
jgi:trk system potassium uptake protein TrkA